MHTWKKSLNETSFRYMDHSIKTTFENSPYTAITSFAIDDALTLSVSNKRSLPILRLWVHPNTVVLGVPDTRLPHIVAGVKLLSESGYHVIVRNSGGLAVALDDGVLNMSLILPNAKKISIHDCYELMFEFVQYMLRDLTDQIKAYEIVGSYCPGDYDLSINGIKFAGISQRRIKDGAAVQIYLDVNGDSKARASLIREFYDLSHKDEETTFNYPTVKKGKMGSLSELLKRDIHMEEMKSRAQNALNDFSEKIIEEEFSDEERITFQKRLQQMNKRNEQIAEIQA